MKFLIITHVLHKKKGGQWFGYAPYINEMNLWLKHVDEVEILGSVILGGITEIESDYLHENINFVKIPSIAFISLKRTLTSILSIPEILFKLFIACHKADHIHLRCPGNIGLLGSIVQVFFPSKIKTAKYAGNWDPNSKQPLSYKFQKWILSNTFLTKNMQVLVYGKWESQTKNIKPFFTATFKNVERDAYEERDYSGRLKLVFIGSLVKGKRPLLAIKLLEVLKKQSKQVHLDMYGDGILKDDLQKYIVENEIENNITLHGNKSKEIIKEALKKTHFLLLLSKSEGWPKAIAEAMFFGVIPIATSISCVPYMLDYGKRGILIEPDLSTAVATLNKKIEDYSLLKSMSNNALKWSQNYTLDLFETEIIQLLK